MYCNIYAYFNCSVSAFSSAKCILSVTPFYSKRGVISLSHVFYIIWLNQNVVWWICGTLVL